MGGEQASARAAAGPRLGAASPGSAAGPRRAPAPAVTRPDSPGSPLLASLLMLLVASAAAPRLAAVLLLRRPHAARRRRRRWRGRAHRCRGLGAAGLERRRREGKRRRFGGRVGWRKGRRRGGAEAARGEAEVEAEAAVPTTRSASHLGRLIRRRRFAFSMSSYPKWVSVLGTLLEAVSGNPNDCAQPKMHMGSVIGDSLSLDQLGVR